MPGISSNLILIAILTGVVPTILWLVFWLREDRFKPEPLWLLILTFLAGAFSIFIAFPLEAFIKGFGVVGLEKIFSFAVVEELVKFMVVSFVIYQSSYLDEPIDYAIYLITGALGFASIENVMFLLNPSLQTDISFIIEVGTLRFLGATVLHSLLAATLGIIIGLAFYKSQLRKRIHLVFGLGFVIILHTIFNYITVTYVELNIFLTFAILWLVSLIIIAMFERVRRVKNRISS